MRIVLALMLYGACLHAAPLAVTMRVVRVPGGPRMAVWYPEAHSPDGHAGERFPLVLFSHGLDGCGTQSVFFTESLAGAGYVVAAPDHRDASCSVEGRRIPRVHLPRLSFANPRAWKDTTYADRREDLENALDWILRSEDFEPMIDASRIGAAGHSLGGYAVLGLAGARESWKDPRIRAAVVFAPYVKPYLIQARLASVGVPVMYQGAQFDLSMTPSLRGSHGAFALSNAPKYYLELRRATHFEWTNGICWGYRQIADCVANRTNARLIVEYAVAFFDRYLKQRTEALEALDGRGLRSSRRAASAD